MWIALPENNELINFYAGKSPLILCVANELAKIISWYYVRKCKISFNDVDDELFCKAVQALKLPHQKYTYMPCINIMNCGNRWFDFRWKFIGLLHFRLSCAVYFVISRTISDFHGCKHCASFIEHYRK